MVDDPGGQLVAGQSGDAPCGKGDAVDGADVLHAVVVAQQRGHVAVAAAVAGVDGEQQDQHQGGQQEAAVVVGDALGHDDQAGGHQGHDEDDLVDGVAVLEGVGPGGEAQATTGVEHGGDGGQQAHGAGQADALDDGLLLRDQRQAAGDVQVEHQPDADEGDGLGLDHVHGAGLALASGGLMPAVGLLEQQVADEHHHEVHGGQDVEHLVDAGLAQVGEQGLHDGAGDGLGRAEARHGQTGGESLAVGEPQHQGLDRREVSGAQADAHDQAVADVDADQGDEAARMVAAVEDEEARADHAQREADRGDQRGLVDVLLNDVAQERRGHAQEEDGKAERPFRGALGVADVVCDLLAEDRPAVHGADAAVQQQRGDRCADPLVVHL